MLTSIIVMSSLLSGESFAQGAQEKLKMKGVEDGLAGVLKNHVNSDGIGKLNGPICKPADSLANQPCKPLPKAEHVSITATVDWASFKGKINDTHGYDEVQDKCEQILMGLAGLDPGDGSYQKAARKQIKSFRCRFDVKATNLPVLDITTGVFTGGFNWETGAEGQIRVEVAQWLMKNL